MTANKTKFSFLKQMSLHPASERQVTLLMLISEHGNLHLDAEAASFFSKTASNSMVNEKTEEKAPSGLTFISSVGQFGSDEKRVINMVAEPLTLKQCKFSRLRDKRKAGIYCTTPTSGPIPSVKYHSGKLSLHCLDANLSDMRDDIGFCTSFLFLWQLSSVMILYLDEFSHEKIKLALHQIRTDEPKRPLAHVICAYRKQQSWALQKLDLVTQLNLFYEQVNVSDAKSLKTRSLNLEQVQGMCEPLTFRNKRVSAAKVSKTLQTILDEVKVQLEVPLSPVDAVSFQQDVDPETLARHNRTLGQFTQYCNRYLTKNYVQQGIRPETSPDAIFDDVVSDFCTSCNIPPEALQEVEEDLRQILFIKLEAFFGKILITRNQSSKSLSTKNAATSPIPEIPLHLDRSHGPDTSNGSKDSQIGSSKNYVFTSNSSVRRNLSWRSKRGRPVTTSFLERDEGDDRSGIFKILDLELNRILVELQVELVESESGREDFTASMNMSTVLKDRMRFENFQTITQVHEEIHRFSKDVSAIRKLVRDFRKSWSQALERETLSETEINQVKANIKLNVSQLRFRCHSYHDELVKLMQSAVKRELILFKRRLDELIAASFTTKPLSTPCEPSSTKSSKDVEARAPKTVVKQDSKEETLMKSKITGAFDAKEGTKSSVSTEESLQMEGEEPTSRSNASLPGHEVQESNRCANEVVAASRGSSSNSLDSINVQYIETL